MDKTADVQTLAFFDPFDHIIFYEETDGYVDECKSADYSGVGNTEKAAEVWYYY